MTTLPTHLKTIEETIQQIKEEQNSIKEVGILTRNLRIERDEIVSEEPSCRFQLPPKGEGMLRLCRQVKAPVSYLSNLDEDVRATVLQRHLERDLGTIVKIFSRNEEALAFTNPKLQHLRGTEALQAIVDGVSKEAPDLVVHQFEWVEGGFVVDLLGPRVVTEVTPGDFILGGLRLSHSFLGLHATQLSAFSLRRVCENGLLIKDCASRTRRLPTERNDALEMQRKQLRRLAAETWTNLSKKLNALHTLPNIRVDIEAILSGWLRRARLSVHGLMPLLRQAWQEEGAEPTAYHAVNAITRVTSHSRELNVRSRRILDLIASSVAIHGDRFCDHCGNWLGKSARASETHDLHSEIEHELHHDH